ncbi:MAG: rhomboid family intramembrane serine protease [Desulfurococcales archaeon]|nr:rhomboid family intramembrane serine protease [Desulfurococcales archaeon]
MPSRSPPVVNLSLIALNVLVFLVGVVAPWALLPGASRYEDIILAYGMIPAYVVGGDRLYTILTSMFLHGGIAHLLGNMLYLYIFGDNIEAVMGRLRYLLFYILSGVGAVIFHIVSIALMPPEALMNSALSFTNPWLVPAVGASGAISGVLGAYIILFPASRVRVVTFWGWFPLMLSVPASIYIGFWFLYQLILGLSTTLGGVSSGIAFWAHIGGFLTGIALTPLFVDKEKLRMAMQALRYYSREDLYW